MILETIGESGTSALIGLFGGVILGLAARIGRFCTLGAVEDFLYSSDNRRIRMWGIAISIAIVGAQTSIYFELLDPEQSSYFGSGWNPVAVVVGGLMFGYGMALSGNCGLGALARLGGGDLRSFVIVLVLGISAYFVMSGPLAHFRLWLFPPDLMTDLPRGILDLNIATSDISASAIGILIGIGLLVISLFNTEMLRSPSHIFWGVLVGVAVVSGWLGTYWIAMEGFDGKPVESHAFAEPLGETISYAMTASGRTVSFSIGSVLGVVVGAALGSYSKGQFRWEACDDPRELQRQLVGAVVMGVGAILSVGCSIGQGISAFSLLTFSGPLALTSIFLGASMGLKHILWGYSARI